MIETSELTTNNITKHPIDRTALIAGIMFIFAGLAYLVDDHGLINVTEGAVAGTIVIVIGLVLLLAALIDSPDTAELGVETNTAGAPATASFGSPAYSESEDLTDNADFSWAGTTGAEPFDEAE